MLASRSRPSFEARMMALADQVFVDFAHLPVRTVMRAFTSSWAETGQTSRPEVIVAHTRAKLAARGRTVVDESAEQRQ